MGIGSDIEEEKRRTKAKALRYKKCVIRELEIGLMGNELEEMGDWCYDIAYSYDQELENLFGDDYEEFKLACATLISDIERFRGDLQMEWIPENYDDMMVAVNKESSDFEMLGYDSWEEDYFGLNGMEKEGQQESEKRLMRLTKQQIIAAAQQCMAVTVSYMSLKNRFNSLQASVDVLRGENEGIRELTKKIDEAHEAAYGHEAYKEWLRWGYRYPSKEMREFDRLLDQIDPYSRIWVE